MIAVLLSALAVLVSLANLVLLRRAGRMFRPRERDVEDALQHALLDRAREAP